MHVINERYTYITNQYLEEILKIGPAGFRQWLWVLLVFALNPGRRLVRSQGSRSSEGERHFRADPDWRSVGLISNRLVVVSVYT